MTFLDVAGIECIYALTKQVIFAVTDEDLKEDEDKLAIVLERQLSYFSDTVAERKGKIQFNSLGSCGVV